MTPPVLDLGSVLDYCLRLDLFVQRLVDRRVGEINVRNNNKALRRTFVETRRNVRHGDGASSERDDDDDDDDASNAAEDDSRHGQVHVSRDLFSSLVRLIAARRHLRVL